MDIRNTLAANAYAQALPKTPARAEAEPPPAETFANAMQSAVGTLQQGEEQARAALTTGADPHSMVMALAQTELAVQTAVTIRDRVVEAYQEILRMPV
jgi:flagellar hook-basal body complex protein FliE